MDANSLWLNETGPSYSPVDRDLRVDVAVIGAGITGLTAAYLLKHAGYHVAVFDRAQVAGGETGHTTAHLTCVSDERLGTLVEDFGRMQSLAVWDAGQFALEEIQRIAAEEAIACGFQQVSGYLLAALAGDDASEAERLHREAHLAAEFGFDADFLEHAPIFGRPALRIANQALFHPVKYVRGLAKAVHREGSFVFEKSEVQIFEENPRRLTVNGCRISYDRCVVATHVPIQARSSTLSVMLRQTKLSAYSTYAISGPVPRGQIPAALFWDTGDPYYYIRIHPGAECDYVIVGGNDHKTGQGDEVRAVEKLREFATRWFPHVDFNRRWSGQVIETVDGLPYIGEVDPYEFLATGFSGNGMTFGTLGGVMARDWVAGRKSPWVDLFSPERKKLSATWEYLRENKDYPVQLLQGHLAGGQEGEPSSVRPGEGRVLRQRGRKIAVFRADDGELSVCSAVCPHLGCIVEWNAAEKTWDCPCHGSRFAAKGEVMAGPAESPLERQSLE